MNPRFPQPETYHKHRIECLEAEVRQIRQAMRVLADAVIAGDPAIVPTAKAVLEMLDPVD